MRARRMPICSALSSARSSARKRRPARHSPSRQMSSYLRQSSRRQRSYRGSQPPSRSLSCDPFGPISISNPCASAGNREADRSKAKHRHGGAHRQFVHDDLQLLPWESTYFEWMASPLVQCLSFLGDRITALVLKRHLAGPMSEYYLGYKSSCDSYCFCCRA